MDVVARKMQEGFGAMQDEIRRELGEDVQKSILEASMESMLSIMGKGLRDSEQDEIKKRIGWKSEDSSQSCLKLLYNSARARILLIAEKIEKYEGCVVSLRPEAFKVDVPDDREWGFKLGDMVRTKGSLEEFKLLQTATVGWGKELEFFHGITGYVKSLLSPYDNQLRVCFKGFTTTLYAGTLEKVGADKVQTRGDWKVGDFVQTISDHQTIVIIHGGVLPIGKRGQIVGLIEDLLLVTFDGQLAFEVNPAMLVHSDDASPIEEHRVPHPRGFEIGQKAVVTSHMKMLIDNQKNSETTGGWHEAMSSLRGKEVTVTGIDKGRLHIQCEGGRMWSINSDSILRKDEKEAQANDLELTSGDVVRGKLPPNIRSILEKLNISLTFLEYLRLTGEVGSVGREYQPYVRFSNWRNTEFNRSFLRKLCDPQRVEDYREVEHKIQHLRADDIVYLDVGPPNFVTEVLRSCGRDESIVKALTNASVLKGYLGDRFAVIAYKDGTMFKVEKNFLSIPQRFYIEGPEEEVNIEISRQVVQAIEDVLRQNTTAEKMIKDFQASSGNPPCIKITTYCLVPDIAEWLRESHDTWMVETLCKGQLLLRIEGFGKIKVEISSVEDAVTPSKAKLSDEMEEAPRVEPKPSDMELRELPFRFFQLYDPALGQDVFLPYVLHGSRSTAPQQQQQPTGTAKGLQVQKKYNVVDSRIGSISNIPRRGGQ